MLGSAHCVVLKKLHYPFPCTESNLLNSISSQLNCCQNSPALPYRGVTQRKMTKLNCLTMIWIKNFDMWDKMTNRDNEGTSLQCLHCIDGCFILSNDWRILNRTSNSSHLGIHWDLVPTLWPLHVCLSRCHWGHYMQIYPGIYLLREEMQRSHLESSHIRLVLPC